MIKFSKHYSIFIEFIRWQFEGNGLKVILMGYFAKSKRYVSLSNQWNCKHSHVYPSERFAGGHMSFYSLIFFYCVSLLVKKIFLFISEFKFGQRIHCCWWHRATLHSLYYWSKTNKFLPIQSRHFRILNRIKWIAYCKKLKQINIRARITRANYEVFIEINHKLRCYSFHLFDSTCCTLA